MSICLSILFHYPLSKLHFGYAEAGTQIQKGFLDPEYLVQLGNVCNQKTLHFLLSVSSISICNYFFLMYL